MKQITLKTLPDSSLQEIFDYISNHLLTQMEKSEHSFLAYISNENLPVGCVYFSIKDGRELKCAAGCLFSDEEYIMFGKNLEGIPFSSNSLYNVGIFKYWNLDPKEDSELGLKIELCRSLQEVHDKNPPLDWKEGLKKVAEEYNLVSN